MCFFGDTWNTSSTCGARCADYSVNSRTRNYVRAPGMTGIVTFKSDSGSKCSSSYSSRLTAALTAAVVSNTDVVRTSRSVVVLDHRPVVYYVYLSIDTAYSCANAVENCFTLIWRFLVAI